jgi:hypothetical protein
MSIFLLIALEIKAFQSDWPLRKSLFVIITYKVKRPAGCMGGFAGVIQVFLPDELTEEYTHWMLDTLRVAENTVFVMSIRPYGVLEITPSLR